MPGRSKSHPQFEHLTTNQLRNIEREFEGGKTHRQLAIKYGVKEHTIRLAARRNGSII